MTSLILCFFCLKQAEDFEPKLEVRKVGFLEFRVRHLITFLACLYNGRSYSAVIPKLINTGSCLAGGGDECFGQSDSGLQVFWWLSIVSVYFLYPGIKCHNLDAIRV